MVDKRITASPPSTTVSVNETNVRNAHPVSQRTLPLPLPTQSTPLNSLGRESLRNSTQQPLSCPDQLRNYPHPGFVPMRVLNVPTTQRNIQLLPGETPDQFHERLRPRAVSSITEVVMPTRIITPSWLYIDVSEIVGIPGAVAICTSTCLHEMPYTVYVGIGRPG